MEGVPAMVGRGMRWALRSFQPNLWFHDNPVTEMSGVFDTNISFGDRTHPIPFLSYYIRHKWMQIVAGYRNTVDYLLLQIYKSREKPKTKPRLSILEQWGSNQLSQWNVVLMPLAICTLCCSVLFLIQHLTRWNSSGLINLTFPFHWKTLSHHVVWANKFQHENPAHQYERKWEKCVSGQQVWCPVFSRKTGNRDFSFWGLCLMLW